MSVEEAKQVAATFTGSSLVPPPRTINDITAILEQQKLADPEAAAKARAKADQKPPDTTSATTLANFYYERGLAAREVGRTKQEIDDLTQAARYAAQAGVPDEPFILRDLGVAELVGGNYSHGMDHLKQAASKVGTFQRGLLIGIYSIMARGYSISGDLQSAEDAARRSQAVYALSQQWAPHFRQEFGAVWEQQAVATQGMVLQAKGQYAEAEAFFRRSVAVLGRDPRWANSWLRDLEIWRLATVLVLQGRLVEAENEARTALGGILSKRGRYSSYSALMLKTLVRVIHEQGRYAEAEALARAAVDMYHRSGATPDSFGLAQARFDLGAALVAQQRWQEALAEFEAIRVGMVGDPETFQKYVRTNINNWALALLNTGHADQALAMLQGASERSRQVLGERHPNTAETRGLLAMAYAATGDRARALKECAEATRVLLNRALNLDDEDTTLAARDKRVAMILTACIGLLSDIKGTPLEQQAGGDAGGEAFRLAEAARGRSVQRAVDASAARASAKTPALADLVRRAQDAKNQLSALYGLLANALSEPTDRQDPKVVADLRGRIESLRQARERLAAQIEREFPAYAQLINPPPVTVEQARAALRPGEALIAFYVAPERTFVWAIPQAGPIAFAAVPLGEKPLEAIVAKLRKALDPGAKVLGDIPEFDVGTAYRLYAALFEPVKTGWQQAESLFIVPHGLLGQLPLSLLPTKPTSLGPETGAIFAKYRAVPWLVRSHAITALPSVTSLATLRALPAGDPNRRPFVGFGDPYFSPEQALRAATTDAPLAMAALGTRGVPIALRRAPETQKFDSSKLAMLPRLPDTAEEVHSIALTLKADVAQDVFLGERANEHVVKTTDLSRYRVLAFATHGLVPGDLDGLTQPALALSAPEVAKVEGDGLLTMEEILALNLNADWVVLSACNTASANGAGDEAVSGLGRAFFYAGARALLVSNWPVETTSARVLTTDLFQRHSANPGLSRARALQETMNALIDGPGLVDPKTNTVVFSYAHPIFWAPFTLVGDGGGGAGAGNRASGGPASQDPVRGR